MTPTIHFRKLRWDDYAQCRNLCDENFHEAELPRFAAAWRKRNGQASFVATYYGTAIACAVVSKKNTIDYIAVHPDFQGYRIGSHLLGKVCKALKDVRSIILKTADDISLPGWYARFGFEESCVYLTDDYDFLGMLMIRRQNCRSATRKHARTAQ
jgi:ribosomal protein S18 acetylase RimI-like enzyme